MNTMTGARTVRNVPYAAKCGRTHIRGKDVNAKDARSSAIKIMTGRRIARDVQNAGAFEKTAINGTDVSALCAG